MPIHKDDIKLFQSQRLTDEDDGGSRATGNVVADGEVNNLFRDISRIDRTVGDVSMRKVFVGVGTDNSDPYLGAHVILANAPQDERVGVVLFNTDSQTDRRAEARNRIESYVVPAVATSWDLLGNQLVGQRSLLAIQREEHRLPEIGEVYRLTNPATGDEQYVRISSVDASVETFTYSSDEQSYTDFERRRLALGLSAPLKATFPGGLPTPSGVRGYGNVAPSVVQTTQVADAARYYGLQPSVAEARVGDLTVKVASVYEHIVPSAQSETPLINQKGSYTARVVRASSTSERTVTLTFGRIEGSHSRAFLQTGAVPRTITLSLAGGSYRDEGDGTFRHTSGSNPFEQITIDYESGQIDAFKSSGYQTGSATAVYRPGAVLTGDTVAAEEEITLQNRGFSYTFDLGHESMPEPGTLVVSYLALGKWYDIVDGGNGQMGGAGSGAIDYATGAAQVTLQALPDPDSALIVVYKTQSDDEVTTHEATVDVGQFEIRHITEKTGLKPGSVVVTYQADGEIRTMTDNGLGSLSGDGVGTVIYADGLLSLVPDTLPDSGTSLSLAYKEGLVTNTSLSVAPDGAGMISGTLPGAPLLPGSVSLEWLVQREAQRFHKGIRYTTAGETLDFTHSLLRKVSDNGAGGWSGVAGTVDYQSGAFTIQATQDYHFTVHKSVRHKTHYHTVSQTNTKTEIFSGDAILVKAQGNSLNHVAHTESIEAPTVTVDLLPHVDDAILPGSVLFEWAGESYMDRAGVIYKNISSLTNAGTAVGTIDYTGGEVSFSSYPPGANGQITIKALATSRAGFQMSHIAFRTPGAPLRPGSLQVWANRADTGERMAAQADFNGVIDTPEMQGFVDSQTGWCKIHFTDGSDDIDVLPQTVFYNTVVLTSIPLDSRLIGLDPVRLPADGRVPIYRAGDVVVLAHEQATEIGTPTAGQTITLERDHQVSLAVIDSEGTPIDAEQVTLDREAGSVRFSDALLLQDGQGQPLTPLLTIVDRIEQMSVVADVQINGDIAIIAPLAWDFPAGSTLSSAVVYGDLQARVKTIFSQRLWDSSYPNWSGERIGSETSAQFNLINYPLHIENRGAIEGKWALVFTSTTSFQIIEEQLGIIGLGSTTADSAPLNPETGTPYWTIRADGWGSGWATGNVLRFDTEGALAPLWLVRTTLAGQGTRQDDQFTLQVRGDAD